MNIEAIFKAWYAVGADLAGLKWEDFYKHLSVAQPEQRPWVGLTDDEWLKIVEDDSIDSAGAIKTAIEAKLKQKND